MRHLAKGTVLHILEMEHFMYRDGGRTITRNLPFMDFLCFEQNLLVKYVRIGELKSTIITCELFLISFFLYLLWTPVILLEYKDYSIS